MKLVFLLFGWLFGLLFFLFFHLSFLSKHYLSAVIFLIITALSLPPIRHLISHSLGFSLPVWVRGVLIPALFFLSVFLIFKGMGNKDSIYKNPEIEKKLMTIYEDRMSRWPVPYESLYLEKTTAGVECLDHIVVAVGKGDDRVQAGRRRHVNAVIE